MRNGRSFFLAVGCWLLFTGCGGGGASVPKATSVKQTAHNQVIASMHVMRAANAIAGLARPITRSVQATGGLRVAMFLTALNRASSYSRSSISRVPVTSQGYDTETMLYYSLVINDDGSGKENLFSDSQQKVSAGSLVWGIPKWNNNQSGSYPAVIHVVYGITRGPYAGVQGAMDVTLNNAGGTNSLIHVILTDLQHEQADYTYDWTGDTINVIGTVVLGNGSSYKDQGQTQPDGTMQDTITYSDGSQEAVTVNPDGTGSSTLDSSSGQAEATGNFDAGGNDTITYNDGSSETVNVDTADGGGGSSSGGS